MFHPLVQRYPLQTETRAKFSSIIKSPQQLQAGRCTMQPYCFAQRKHNTLHLVVRDSALHGLHVKQRERQKMRASVFMLSFLLPPPLNSPIRAEQWRVCRVYWKGTGALAVGSCVVDLTMRRKTSSPVQTKWSTLKSHESHLEPSTCG